MNRRRTLRPTGLLMLAAMLFAQAAIAFIACDVIPTTPFSRASDEPCHEEGSTNLCHAHCQAENLTLDKPQLKVHALAIPWTPALRTPAVPLSRAAVRPAPEPWADPPPRILLHRLLV